jgi:hypothetical protein
VSGSNPSESGEYDLEVQLERSELVDLLDKALNLLPPITRSALIQQFVDERPQHEIAERLGMSRGAVAMRIHRGKLLLRQALIEQFPDDAESFGLLQTEQGWMETTIWCPLCGDRRFHGLTDNEDGAFYLNCRGCFANSGIMWCEFPVRTHEKITVEHGYRATYDGVVRFMRDYLLLALTVDHAKCLNCDSVATLNRSLPDIAPWLGESFGVHLRCPECSAILSTHLSGMLLSRSEGYRFWHEHGRIRTLPEAQIEVDGRPAIVSRFESVSGAENLVAITDAETLRPIQFHRTTR